MSGSRLVSGLRKQSPAFWVNLAVKAVLISLLVFGAFSGLQQFEGKVTSGGWSHTLLPPW